MKKLKNKKSFIFLLLVLFIGIIGGTFAYYTSSHVFENVFHTNPYQTEVIETFISPDDWLPGTTTPKEVAVTNKGSVNVGVRISFTEEWEDANGDPLPLKDSENRPIAVINFASDLSNWNEVVEDGTTYYYYTEELEPNETTDPLIESVTFRSDLDMNVDSSCTTTGNITECSTMIDGHIGGKYTLTIKVQTMQFDQMHLVKAYFDTGPNVNAKMKALATVEEVEQPIVAILKGIAEPSIENKEEKNIVSLSDSPKPIYMWYDNTTQSIYWWSEDNHPEMNSDSSYMFAQLFSLTNISGLSDFMANKVKNLGYAFNEDHVLSDYTPLSNWNTGSVTNFNRTFRENSSMTSVEAFRNWNTSKAITFYSMFGGNMENGYPMHITSLEPLSNWDTSNVSTMTYMFRCNFDLTNLHGLENWNINKVSSLEGTFAHCKSLTDNLALEKWNSSRLINIADIFNNCSNMTNGNGVRYWNTSKVTKMYRAFNVGNNDPNGRRTGLLRDLDLSRWDFSKVNQIEWMFDSQPYLVTEFTVRATDIATYGSMFAGTATEGQVIVNYTAESEAMVDRLIATKTSGCNVSKGRLVE